MLIDILNRHRGGPYRFCITRPKHGGKYTGDTPRFCNEWLTRLVADKEDVGREAWALLQDPRDTICSVGVWSEKEQQFLGTIRSEKDL